MLGLPQSTEFNKRIPKQKFYENLAVTPALKKIFVDQIRVIYWRNKVAATTVNVAEGSTVKELEVFEISLNQQSLNESVLKQIDKEIPYHILFVLTHNGQEQAWIGYKEASESANTAFKVSAYYHTKWETADELKLKLEGLNMDAVYESLVRQVAGDILKTNNTDETLKKSVEKNELKKKLETQIAQLKKKIRNEKQLNKQMELNAQLKNLKRELEAM